VHERPALADRGLRGELLLPLDERRLAPETALAELGVDLELHLGRPDEPPPAFGGGLAHDLLQLVDEGVLGLLEPLPVRLGQGEDVPVRRPDLLDPDGLAGVHLPHHPLGEFDRL
jgi:hypothetical protein